MRHRTKNHSQEIVVVGSLNADLVVTTPRFPAPGQTVVGQHVRVFPGGKGANQACAAARLGASVSMIGRIGRDAHGQLLLRSLASAGANVEGVQRDPRVPTGVASILTNAAGENQIIIVPGANGVLRPHHLRPAHRLITSARVLLLQLEIPLAVTAAAAQFARRAGTLVVLDPAPARRLPDRLLACVDYLTPNETELAILTGCTSRRCSLREVERLARGLCRHGPKNVIVKLGGRGALLVSPDRTRHWPAFPVKAVDTTAAGDAFNGAFAWALAAGQSEAEAGRLAAAAAACSVTHAGAQPSMPSMLEVQRLLRRFARTSVGPRYQSLPEHLQLASSQFAR
ncbi:MAG: ribokinase [Verrucomicrobia bacterium]|nr:ribokinase [Verrucomicrobiota bacterium]